MQNWITFITTGFVFMLDCFCLLGLDSAVGLAAPSGGYESTMYSSKNTEL